MTSSECIWPAEATLGEGPLWHAQEQALYWVDIKGPTLFRWTELDQQQWEMPCDIGAVLPAKGGGLICALASGLHHFDTKSGALTLFCDPEPEQPGNRLNDACTDRDGNIWVGSMDNAGIKPSGRFYRIGGNGECVVMDYECAITNGPAASPDGRLFFTDSQARKIFVTAAAQPDFANARLFAQFSPSDGFPDGMCCDSERCLWVALWGGGCVSRFSPEGRLLEKIAVPADQVTKCAFGGEHLDTLFITTAREGLSRETLVRQPLAGGLFRYRTLTRGFPIPIYCGNRK